LEERIPDAARVLKEFSKGRDALAAVAREAGNLAAETRELLQRLEAPAQEMVKASETISTIERQLAALRDQVDALREQAENDAGSLEEAVTGGLAGVRQLAEEHRDRLLNGIAQVAGALQEMGPAVTRAVQETGERL